MITLLKNKNLVVIAAALFTTTLVSCDKDENPASTTVVNAITNNGYSTLASLATTAGLIDTLNATGPFTVFAPNNDAFTGVTAPTGAALANLLRYHIIRGQALSAANVLSLSNGNLVRVVMANGDSVFVRASSAGVFVNGVRVTAPNLTADNGVVHGVNRILFPPTGNLVETANSTPGFDSLVKAVVRVSGSGVPANLNVATILSTLNAITVFAPTNQAFADLFANAAFPFRNIDQIPVDVLRTVLLHHAVTSRAFSNDLANGTIAMANGTNITVSGVGTANLALKGSSTVFDNTAAGVTRTDIMTRNGVIHAINKVLIP